MTALLLGCGLRRAQLAGPTVEALQQREEHWVIADLVGKGGHVRTVAVLSWVKTALDAWLTGSNVTAGPIFPGAKRVGLNCADIKKIAQLRLTRFLRRVFSRRVFLPFSPTRFLLVLHLLDDELFSQATSATTSYMSIAAGLSATKTGFELIKGIRDLLKGQKVDAGEISARMLELQELMLDARTALTEAQDENAKLEARIADLARMALFGKDFKSAHGVYWYQDFPYCPICWDVDRKPVRLAGPVPNERYRMWTCPFHKPPYALPWNAKAPAV